MTTDLSNRMIRSLLSDEEIRQLAVGLASDLFRDGFGRHASRLVMEYDEGQIDGTGWCEAAVAHRIEKVLKLPAETKD